MWYGLVMGLWLHSTNPSEPNPSKLDPGWHVSKQYNDLSHVLAPDDMHSVDPS